jgi:hypothetical protein
MNRPTKKARFRGPDVTGNVTHNFVSNIGNDNVAIV